MKIEGLSSAITDHLVALRPEMVPPAALHAARRVLLDGVGTMLAASGLADETRPFIDHARTGNGGAPVLGSGFSSSPELAALANGAMAHAIDFEDAFDAAPCHPNASALPAVLAVASTLPDLRYCELLTAIAAGCDLVCRLGLALRRPMEAGGWYPPPILGAFGAVAAAGMLRKLNSRQTLDAFSMMLCQVSVPGEIKHSRDTVLRAVRESFPAQAAVQVSALAAMDVRGFDEPFAGEAGFYRLFAGGDFDPQSIMDGLGQRFLIEDLTFKRWPACRGTHAYIEAVQSLRTDHGIAAERVCTIIATGGPVQRMLVDPAERKAAPATAIDAKFSIPFTIALALTEPEVGLESFAEAKLRDENLRQLAKKVRYREHPDWGREQAAWGIVELELDNGERFECAIENAIGHPRRPLDDAALVDKFLSCVGHARLPLKAGHGAEVAAQIMSADAETRWEELQALITR